MWGLRASIRRAALRIDAHRYSSNDLRLSLALIYAIWRFCAAEAFNICNGNRIDNRKPCSGAGCPIMRYCVAKFATGAKIANRSAGRGPH